ncbi:uroporphyrinogen-III C-methyltransferase [Bacillus kexueae]|uniref:uroporphyrinogen-III C-methyltransferase n=1 Tax=Aeribacillus kexueae TaxID=2078952 RepID=UPI001FAE89BF|nr:uroporphyrinogen-III C-methyltransferase [Bacillus kexueae]
MGKVYIVGAGPGDPELITIKALKCIQKADVIMYDRLVNKELLSYAKEGADLIYCGKLPNYHTMKQETINKFLVKYAKAGKTVVRLKGGDPYVFGRGGEEAEYVAKHQIPFEVVPGITASIAASSYSGIPLTQRNISGNVTILTGHRVNEENHLLNNLSFLKAADTLCIYMGIGNIETIQAQLLKADKSEQTPVAFVEWASTDKQRTIISSIEKMAHDVNEKEIENPCLIIVGEVVKFHSKLNWFEDVPSRSMIVEAGASQ